ncbi:MAG: hypothetical protein HGA76_10215, partial [Candidatus Firestonebacteria bacterium]|nr:hypothetical protein [Candidatus Firestonebacteria bacterium]
MAVGSRQLPPRRIEQARHPWLALGLILGFAGLIVGGVWFVYASGLVANRFKPDIERELSKALNRPVTMERLEGGVFDRVVLRHVVIGAPANDPDSLSITIDRVVVRYSLWDILVKKKALAEGLREIQLIRPLIRIERGADGVWHSPNLISWAGSAAMPMTVLPPIKLSLAGGEMRFTAPGQSLSLHHLRGFLNFKDSTHVPLFLSGRTGTEHLQNVKVSGELDLTRGQFNLGLSAEKLALRPAERMVRFSPYLEVLGGTATISLKAASRPPSKNDLIPGVDLQGKLILNQCAAKTTLVNVPLRGLVGVTLLHNDHLSIKNLQGQIGKTFWSATGTIQHLQRPTLFLKVENQRLRLVDLVESFPRFGQLKTTGEGSEVILVQGTVPDLTATATVHLANGKIGQMVIRNFESICRYAHGELNLLLAKGVVAHGTAEGHGRIRLADTPQEAPSIDFFIKGQALSLHDLGSLFKISNLEGDVDAQVSVTGRLDHPTWKGEVSAPVLSWGKNEFKECRVALAAGPDQAAVTAKANWGALTDLALELALSRKLNIWQIQPFRVSRRGEELLRVAGKYSPEENGALDVSLKGKQIPLALMPVWPAGLRHINGPFTLQGRCGGTFSHPRLTLKASSPRLCRDSEANLDLKSELFWDGERLQILALEFDRGRALIKGILDFKAKTLEQGELRLMGCPVESLAVLAGVAPAVQGRVQGLVNMHGPFRQFVSKGELQFSTLKGKYLSAQSGTANFTTNGKNIWIKRFELSQGHGKLNATLETNGDKNGYLHARAWLDGFELAGHRYAGDMKLDGTPRGSAGDYHLTLATGNLARDAEALPPATGVFEWQGSTRLLTVKNAAWGGDLALTGQVNLEKAPVFQLQASFDHARLKALREFFQPDAKPAREPLSGTVRLQGTEGVVKADLNLLLGTGELKGTVQTEAAAGNTPAG